jgi:hypothetical protein
MFRFWGYLSCSGHQKTIWVPYLRRVSRRGTSDGYDGDEPVVALNRQRDRLEDHEHVLSDDLATRQM